MDEISGGSARFPQPAMTISRDQSHSSPALERTQRLLQIVHFHESYSRGAINAAHDRCVIACREICYDGRFPSICGSPSSIEDLLDLVVHYNPADYCRLPIIVGGNQSSGAIVQFECWISQNVGYAELTEFRANRANNHSLWSVSCNDETSNHDVVIHLDEATST